MQYKKGDRVCLEVTLPDGSGGIEVLGEITQRSDFPYYSAVTIRNEENVDDLFPEYNEDVPVYDVTKSKEYIDTIRSQEDELWAEFLAFQAFKKMRAGK